MRTALILALLLPGAACAAGEAKLLPAACGVRNTLWIEHYAAQLFVPPGNPAAVLSDPGQPKMVRMRILNSFLMPSDIPRRWRDALQPVVQPETMARLRDRYDGLRPGDHVIVSYAPQDGVTVQVNDEVVARERGHAAIEALLEAWADDAPLDKKLAGTLRRNPCG